MRPGGQVSLAIGVLIMGGLFLVACGPTQPRPTEVLATATPSVSATPVPSPIAYATATKQPVLQPSPSATAAPTNTATALPPPSPSAAVTAAATATVSATATVQEQLTLTSIDMVTVDQGWATGLGSSGSAGGQVLPAVGDVFQTSDGGTTWQNVSPSGVSAGSIDAAFFLDGANAWIAEVVPTTSAGVAVSTTMAVYGTIDGGRTWHTGNAFAVSAAGPAVFSFADTLHGWIMIGLYTADGSEAVEILKTVDGGVNWQPISLALSPAGQSTPGSLPYSCDKAGITFIDATTGWAAGSCSSGPLFLYVTQDGGQTWQPQTLPPPPGDPADLYSNCLCAAESPTFVSAQDGVLAITVSQFNQGTYLYVTRDGGFTWAVRELPVALLFGAPDFFSASDGIVTDGQRLFSTSDGGATWTQSGTLPISGTNLVGSIDFVDPNDGWVTDGQHLYATHDGSQTWITITPVVVPSPPSKAPPVDITLANNGQTLTLQVDDEFLLDLGTQYTWTVTIDNPTIVAPVVSQTTVTGTQGTYEALRTGTATLVAAGEPVCRQSQPPCALPSRQFQLQIVVQ
jgi:photosystem II stability/assembly factor-like uncharacterized protein